MYPQRSDHSPIHKSDMPNILGKIHWLVTNITPSEICAADYLTQCHPCPNVTWKLAEFDRLDRFVIYYFQTQSSRVCTHMTKINYWNRNIACKFLPSTRQITSRSWIIKRRMSPLQTQWSGTSMELGLVISIHNTPPGLTRQIAIKSPQSTDLHRWYSTHCGLNALRYF